MKLSSNFEHSKALINTRRSNISEVDLSHDKNIMTNNCFKKKMKKNIFRPWNRFGESEFSKTNPDFNSIASSTMHEYIPLKN